MLNRAVSLAKKGASLISKDKINTVVSTGVKSTKNVLNSSTNKLRQTVSDRVVKPIKYKVMGITFIGVTSILGFHAMKIHITNILSE